MLCLINRQGYLFQTFMSRNFIVIKVNLDLLNPVLLHVVYTVVVIIVDMYDYLSEDSVPRRGT